MTTTSLDDLKGATFFKLCGSGNDFVGFDGRVVRAPSRSEIVALCDRRRGIGADGVVRLSPGSREGHVRLDYWNSDGSDAALCGNGSLCSAVFARELGIAVHDRLVLETGAGEVGATVLGRTRAEIGVGAVLTPREASAIERAEGEHSIDFTSVGVPHLVVVVDDPAAVDLPRRGRELRFHPSLGPAGANVNFVARAPHGDSFALRTYERGVEGETLACGTGATATAIALLSRQLAQGRVTLLPTGGSPLEVLAEREPGRFIEVRLRGEGRIVFRGVLNG